MKVLQDGTLLAYIEGFYQSDTDAQRALYGAYIIGYLEAVFGMYIRPEEHQENGERKDKYVTLHHKDIHFIDEDAEKEFYESLEERKEE